MSEEKENDTLPMDEPNELLDPPKLEEEAQPEPEDVKGENREEPPASKPDTVPLKALEDERRKRQELEDRVAAMQQQYEKQNAEPPADLWEDTGKWQQQFGSNLVGAAVQQSEQLATVRMSEMLARRAYEDFPKVQEKWREMAAANPALQQEALSSPDPWDTAYKQVKRMETIEQLGDKSLDDVRAEVRAELEAELKAQAPKFPTSTVTDGSVAPRNPGFVPEPAFKLPMDG